MGIYFTQVELGQKALDYVTILHKTESITEYEQAFITKYLGSRIHLMLFGKLDFIDRSTSYTQGEQYFIERILARIIQSKSLGIDPFDSNMEGENIASIPGLLHDFDQLLAGQLQGETDFRYLDDDTFKKEMINIGFLEDNVDGYISSPLREGLREIAFQKATKELENQIVLS